MKNKKWISILVIGLIAMVVTIGALNVKSVLAASTDDEVPSVLTFKSDLGRGISGFSKTDLAEALGITEDELTAAIQSAKEAAIAQGVEQGLITQAQADELSSSDQSSRVDRVLTRWLAKSGIDYEALLAGALGITVDELKEAYQVAAFAQIDQALTDGKITEEQALLAKGQIALQADATFQSTMQSAYEAAVQQAVESGVITQEQADLILESASQKISGTSWGLTGMFGFDRDRRPGHGDRGMLPEALEEAPVTEP